MKKFLIMSMFIMSALSFGAQLKVPADVEKEINNSARSFDSSQRVNFINWQKRSYLKIESLGKESGIPEDEFLRIKNRLHRMYGSNYAKQLQILPEEMNDYRELVRRVQEATKGNIVDEEVNEKAKEQMKVTLLNAVRVPTEILNVYQESAKELFPNNYVMQEKFVSACIRDYYNILPLLKKELEKEKRK